MIQKIVQFHTQTEFLNYSNCTTRDIGLINDIFFKRGECGGSLFSSISRGPHYTVPRTSEGLNPALVTGTFDWIVGGM